MHSLEQEHKDTVGSQILDATTQENRVRIQEEFGFKSHGLVIYGPDGTLLEKLDGHLLKEPEIRGALDRALKAGAGAGVGS